MNEYQNIALLQNYTSHVIGYNDRIYFNPYPEETDDIYDIKEVYFNSDREDIFHYCVYVTLTYSDEKERGDIGGVAELPTNEIYGRYDEGDDFLISTFYTEYLNHQEKIGYFMHELGHNLGLKHFGKDEFCPHYPNHDGGRGCPNYLSIMSYEYGKNPSNWPIEWNSYPNFGTNPGEDDIINTEDDWKDWEEIYFSGIEDGD